MWVRLIEKQGLLKLKNKKELKIRSLAEVLLFRHEAGVFVIQDIMTNGYLPWPSVEPYVVIFISQEQYEVIQQAINRSLIDQLVASMKSAIAAVPNFSFEGIRLSAPDNYARASPRNLDHQVITLE